jgi:Skp family chaperone for outer membrane proteins
MTYLDTKTKAFALAIICLIAATNALNAQNTAFIYRDSILAVTPGYIPSIKKVDSLKRAYATEIDAANKEWETKVNKLLAAYNPKKDETIDVIKKRMTVADTTQFELLIKESSFISEKAKTYNQLYQQAFAKDVQSILNKVDAIISKYAQANKLDYVFMMEEIERSLAYMNKGKNITQPIRQEVVNLK